MRSTEPQGNCFVGALTEDSRTLKKLICLLVVAVAATSIAQQGGNRQRGPGRNQLTPLSLLQRSDVQTELKISDEQKAKLAELQPQRGQGRGGGGNGGGGNIGGPGGDPAAFRAAQLEREKKVLDVLTPAQQARLKQLFLQRAGARAIVREDIQKELGLDEKQIAKVQELVTKQREAQQAVMEKVRSGELDRAAVRETTTKNDKILGEELTKVLTPAQQAKLKALGGPEFKFEEETGN